RFTRFPGGPVQPLLHLSFVLRLRGTVTKIQVLSLRAKDLTVNFTHRRKFFSSLSSPSNIRHSQSTFAHH
ncbi:MAG: hypothetical protein RR996_05465, partial [Alistipes sp.]